MRNGCIVAVVHGAIVSVKENKMKSLPCVLCVVGSGAAAV